MSYPKSLVSLTVDVEEKAFELIAKYQPVASDLRIINSYMKIAYDFERYGRYAWDISFIRKRLGGLEGLRRMDTSVHRGHGGEGSPNGSDKHKLA